MVLKSKAVTNCKMRSLFLPLSLSFEVVLQSACSFGSDRQPLAGGTNEVTAAPQWATPAVEQLLPGVWRVRFGTPERFTPVAVRESAPRVQGFASLPAPAPLPFEPDQIRCRISTARTTVYVPCEEPGQQIYGFGLDPGAYQQKGLCKNLTVCAAVVGETGASHGPVPFYLSTKGYEVFVDTARVPMVEVARLTPNQSAAADEPRSGQIKTSEGELYAARAARGRTEVIFDLPGNSKGVDVYVFGGPTMREAVQRYNLFSGGGAVPPLWGLGLKFRTFTRADEATVLKTARALRAMEIPCDMIGLEPGWQSKSYSCSFTWSKERFPEPAKMLQELQQAGFKVNLWEHAYIHPSSPLFAPLKSRAGDFLVWGGLVVDFVDPEASRIFADYHDRELVSKGILGFKGDECDKQPPTDATPFNYPYCSIFPSGIDGDQMTQLYGYLYQRSLFSAFKAHNLRTWGDVRATTALAAPLPFNLYSDAYSFDQYLRQLVNASFTGLLWSPEVREAHSLDELLNRVALSAFAPQMCLDMWFMPNPVWEQYDRPKNEARQLLPEAEQRAVADRLRSIVSQRYALLPYLYSSFQRYHNEGLPPVRSLLLDFPEDTQIRKLDNAFMFGDSLLAAPFLGEAASRKIVLPRGVAWYELKTKQWHQGGTNITVSGSPGEMPLFVRENSLLPLAEPVQQIDGATVFEITVKVFGERPTPFTLFEDDGTTFDFESGAASRVVLTCDQAAGGKAERTGAFTGWRYKIVRWEAVPGPAPIARSITPSP
jgi:alpha-D-xyloside xylohydrolase